MAAGSSKGPLGSEKASLQLTQLEQKLDHLRRKFNSFFNGFDRVPPTLEFETLKAEFRELQRTQFSTGQSRFKAQNLIARWQIQRGQWERNLQRREEGTYKPGAQAASMQRKPEVIDDLD